MPQTTSTDGVGPLLLAHLAPRVQKWTVCRVISASTIGELTEYTLAASYRAGITTLANLTLIVYSRARRRGERLVGVPVLNFQFGSAHNRPACTALVSFFSTYSKKVAEGLSPKWRATTRSRNAPTSASPETTSRFLWEDILGIESATSTRFFMLSSDTWRKAT